MQSDERAIRNVIDQWMKASKVGEISVLSNLMSDDVVFLVAGRPPMRGRAAFLAD